MQIKKDILVTLNILQLLVLGFSLMIYTSLNRNFPWYDSCGLQFLGILSISIPVLLAIGLILRILSIKYEINTINRLLPIYSAVGLGLPILLDGSLSRITIIIGTFLCVVFIVMTMVLLIRQFRHG